MNKKEIIEQTEQYVKETLAKDCSGHGFWHVERVRKLALQISDHEQAEHDKFTVELAALLHDIADYKFHGGDDEAGPRVSRSWLENFKTVPEKTINAVCEIIRHLSFKGANVEQKQLSIEGQIVQDADRIDAIGAIGVARVFAYGGHKGHKMHDPAISPVLHDSPEAYKTNKSTSVNHFHEKLLLLKDRINTGPGKKLAQERHDYMVDFLKTFEKEWNVI